MSTYKKTITTILAMGGTQEGRAGVVTDENLEESIESTRQRLSRQAQLNANIITVEEARNTLVVVFDNGAVEIHKWLKVPETGRI